MPPHVSPTLADPTRADGRSSRAATAPPKPSCCRQVCGRAPSRGRVQPNSRHPVARCVERSTNLIGPKALRGVDIPSRRRTGPILTRWFPTTNGRRGYVEKRHAALACGLLGGDHPMLGDERRCPVAPLLQALSILRPLFGNAAPGRAGSILPPAARRVADAGSPIRSRAGGPQREGENVRGRRSNGAFSAVVERLIKSAANRPPSSRIGRSIRSHKRYDPRTASASRWRSSAAPPPRRRKSLASTARGKSRRRRPRASTRRSAESRLQSARSRPCSRPSGRSMARSMTSRRRGWSPSP